MASMEQAHGSNQLSDKEKTAIGEAMKEAESLILAKNKNAKATSNQDEQVVFVTGFMKNICSKDMYITKTSIFDGEREFMDPPAKRILGYRAGMFVHMSLPLSHSKGAIIYDHAPNGSDPDLGWLLAWDKSNDFNKVYVEAGTLDRINKIPDSVITQKLAVSGNISRFWDSETGASVAAEIKKWDSSMSLLVVTFDQVM
ncbi:uncharacterized protein [Spinacia oleracea]|uniref:Uncharacterized protein n=1 Tax=Spinacia oleracea TaxID=3562 RepID=A0A9R0JQI0_SPIOL|nr:uncharacterized protein LOC110783362 [Spinacia oleracea]